MEEEEKELMVGREKIGIFEASPYSPARDTSLCRHGKQKRNPEAVYRGIPTNAENKKQGETLLLSIILSDFTT